MKYLTYFNTLLLIAILVKLFSTNHKSGKKIPSNCLIMDSSGLIDGRIIQLAQSGFIQNPIDVPAFIVNELQMLADGSDTHKRERARYGLDVINELQKNTLIEVIISRDSYPEVKKTDDKLIAHAKNTNGVLYTTDYNLSKVALVEKVKVMNANELSQNLRPIALPGETVTVKIIQKGSGTNQGVGYLDDGTMIVVDNAYKLKGKFVKVSVDRMHQSVAGKMIFAKLTK